MTPFKVMKSSPTARLATIATPLLLLVSGVGALARHPGSIGAILTSAVGAALALIALLDFPWESRCTAEGLERRCLARHHLIPWHDVAAIESIRSATTVVTVTRRRYLLAAATKPGIDELSIPEGIALRR